MRRSAMLLAAATLPFLLSSCFVLNDFWVGAPTLAPGVKTPAYFILYPATTTPTTTYQFVLVGVDDPTQLGIGRAKWGANGTFGGPMPMTAEPNLANILGAAQGICEANGLDFANITGLTWKGFRTPVRINDKGKVGRPAQVTVGLKAKIGATPDTRVSVVGVTGVWADNNSNGTLDPAGTDGYLCTGIGSSSTYIT